ncbi:hypothetical protein WMY93_002301 [Mugilogobius chulae]|uniref:Uncharacterized protein n=1 Tax=Mugilogobius chulae TaxID=88201 RepID=A0AAW0Q1Q2_9GOBI
MKRCLLLLLLGSCDGYTNISQAWRHVTSYSEYFWTYPYDDSFMVSHWWRFVGVGGDVLVWACKTGGTGDLYSIGVEKAMMPTTELSSATPVTAHSFKGMPCKTTNFVVEIVLCPGGFYIYRPLSHVPSSGYTTWHSLCNPDSCGPNAVCGMLATFGAGFCTCNSGFKMEHVNRPPEDELCLDIDECEDEDLCGSHGNCTNYDGGYNCTCFTGYELEYPTLPPSTSNQCSDINECLNATTCDENASCGNTDGSYTCTCIQGFYSDPPACKDIDDCVDSAATCSPGTCVHSEMTCGPVAVCNNTIGSYSCTCEEGYRETNINYEPSSDNICIDINECVEEPTVCGSNGDCFNTEGSFYCECFSGYRLNLTKIRIDDPCVDIDECSETVELCGPRSFCANRPGTYTCACSDRFYSSTGIIWTEETECESEIFLSGKNKKKAFFANMDKQLKESKGKPLHEAVAGVGPFVVPPKVSSAGDGETGTIILDLSKRLIEGLLENDIESPTMKLTTSTMDLDVGMFKPKDYHPKSFSLGTGAISMAINIEEVTNSNNGYAAVAFMTLKGLDSLLSNANFKTENATQFASDVFSAFLPKTNYTNFTDPVNFTIQHQKTMPDGGLMTCTYWVAEEMVWEDNGNNDGVGASGYWSEEGCWVSFTNENYTVCSCSHLSTFALIMQIGEVSRNHPNIDELIRPPPESHFLDWLNRICVIVGLFFFTLAILTFLLCSWNPKINNTARLHLCLNLGLSHLLLLLNENFYADQLACKAIAGILHFLVVSSFVWMLLEAVQLYMLVRRLNKVQVIQRDGLPKLALYFIGYGVPLVVVGVSALVYNAGYGRTPAKVCWLSTTRGFNWALTGPIVTILGLNLMLFCLTLWSLRTTLANMRKGASESKDAKLVLFKIVAQFVILGCTWILGLYQTNLFFQVMFIILNSQQGTFLYIVHCMLNKEIREECLKCLSCSHYGKKNKADGTCTTLDQDK